MTAAALDTTRSTPIPQSAPAPSNGDTVAILATPEMINITLTEENGVFSGHVDQATLMIPFGELTQITWNIVPPPGVNPETLFFQSPALNFPQGQQSAPFLTIKDPGEDTLQYTVLWANIDPCRIGVYSYTVNIACEGQSVVADPTVENDSPTG